MNWVIGLIGIPFLFSFFKRVLFLLNMIIFRKAINKNRGNWFIYSSSFITAISATLSIVGIKYIFVWLNFSYSNTLLLISSAVVVLFLTIRVFFQPPDKNVLESEWDPEPNSSDERNIYLREKIEKEGQFMSLIAGTLCFLVAIFS